jgi:predicted nuclease of predicted toxin-antitoxin system
MRFLGDMGISPRGIAFLRDQGFEAVHLHELGLERLPDAEIVTIARHEGYIVLTHDLDLGELLATSGADVPSVVIFRLQDMRPESVNGYLRVLVTEHHSVLNEGAVVAVSEGRIRVRKLPIERLE